MVGLHKSRFRILGPSGGAELVGESTEGSREEVRLLLAAGEIVVFEGGRKLRVVGDGDVDIPLLGITSPSTRSQTPFLSASSPPSFKSPGPLAAEQPDEIPHLNEGSCPSKSQLTVLDTAGRITSPLWSPRFRVKLVAPASFTFS